MTINQLPTMSAQYENVALVGTYNGYDYKVPLKQLVLQKTVSGTPSATGNISLGLDNNYVVLSVARTDDSSICTPFMTSNGTAWYAHITTIQASPTVVTTNVGLTVFYLPTVMF